MSAVVSPITTPVELARGKNGASQKNDAAAGRNERDSTRQYSRNHAQENIDNVNYV
jgi:hypothetical protein